MHVRAPSRGRAHGPMHSRRAMILYVHAQRLAPYGEGCPEAENLGACRMQAYIHVHALKPYH